MINFHIIRAVLNKFHWGYGSFSMIKKEIVPIGLRLIWVNQRFFWQLGWSMNLREIHGKRILGKPSKSISSINWGCKVAFPNLATPSLNLSRNNFSLYWSFNWFWKLGFSWCIYKSENISIGLVDISSVVKAHSGTVSAYLSRRCTICN